MIVKKIPMRLLQRKAHNIYFWLHHHLAMGEDNEFIIQSEFTLSLIQNQLLTSQDFEETRQILRVVWAGN